MVIMASLIAIVAAGCAKSQNQESQDPTLVQVVGLKDAYKMTEHPKFQIKNTHSKKIYITTSGELQNERGEWRSYTLNMESNPSRNGIDPESGEAITQTEIDSGKSVFVVWSDKNGAYPSQRGQRFRACIDVYKTPGKSPSEQFYSKPFTFR